MLSAIHYLDSDGLPLAENDFQRNPLTYEVQTLSVYFQTRDDVYVTGNLFIYYEEGERTGRSLFLCPPMPISFYFCSVPCSFRRYRGCPV